MLDENIIELFEVEDAKLEIENMSELKMKMYLYEIYYNRVPEIEEKIDWLEIKISMGDD